jgi:hypothetical protein
MQSILSRIAEFSQHSACTKVAVDEISHDDDANSSADTTSAIGRKLSLVFVCFSKGRPFQLQQLLTSLKQYVCLDRDHQIFVVYKSERFSSEYSRLISLHDDVSFIAERDFVSDLISCLSGGVDVGNTRNTRQHVCFCVDDLIFTNYVNVDMICNILNETEGSQILGFLLKLHMGIWYSHAASKACKPPRVVARRRVTRSTTPSGLVHRPIAYLEYAMSSSNRCDWMSYFDLCGGLYRTKDVLHLIHCAVAREGRQSIGNPNLFEYTLNRLIADGELSYKGYRLCALPAAPCLTVVTINRVQSTYDVPIYENEGGQLDAINSLCASSECRGFDLAKYATASYLSVHVGDLYLEYGRGPPPSVNSNDDGIECFDTSVVIPVHNGGKYIEQCLLSLLGQSQGCSFEVIIIDDGSTDSSMDICNDILHRIDVGHFTKNPHVRMKIVKLEKVGLAAALDRGIAEASSELVARLDADDICEPGRLGRQVAFLRQRPDIHVVGGQVLLISSETCGSGNRSSSIGAISEPSLCGHTWELDDSRYDIAGLIPTHPILVHWYMLFKCCVMHPTVMFRKDVVVSYQSTTAKCEGKSDTQSQDDSIHTLVSDDAIEDYRLWMRILQR